jgi:hypothetical protein
MKVDADSRTRIAPQTYDDRVAVAITALLQVLVRWQMSLKCVKLVFSKAFRQDFCI